jgi:uncharacterized protein YaiI (UPF0178 family)
VELDPIGGGPAPIIVDADAAPRECLRIIDELAAEFGREVITVASIHHRIDRPNHRVVGDEPQATDLAVINLTRPGTIVVTQDQGLAALVLAKGAAAIAPHGEIFRDDRMDAMLEERNILARWRRSGGRTKGPSPRSKADNLRFAANLRSLLEPQ